MSTPTRTGRRSRRAAAVIATSCLLVSWAQGQGIWQPGGRWSHGPAAAQPWIPLDVALAADGEICWAAPAVANPHLVALSGSARPAPEVLFADRRLGPVSGSLEVCAGRRADVLGALVQRPAPDAFHRRTEIHRYDPVSTAASGAAFAPVWTHDMGPLVNAPARLSCDARGDRLVAALHDAAAGHVQVDWLDADDGALLHRELVPAGSLRRLEVSADGGRVLLSAGLGVWVLDEQGVVHHEVLASATDGVAFASDGASFAYGQPGWLHVARERSTGFATAFSIAASATELATRAALSADGDVVAVGWWNAADGVSARFEAWDVAAGTRWFTRSHPGVAGGLQNFPQAVELTADGRRAAFASWGDGDGDPEVWIVDRDAGEVLRVDLPGSAFALDLAADGTRVAVATKSVHANQFGTTGEVRMFDTGDRNVQAVGQARLGQTLRIAARDPAATRAVFLVGPPSAAPGPIPGAAGVLWLDRDAGVSSSVRRTDSHGRSSFLLQVPNDPAWIGRRLGVQVAFRTPGGTVLSEHWVLPVVVD